MISSFTSSIIFALGCILASRQLHELLLENVMRWPMEIFDQTPVGRILNRFSKEIDVLDIVLPQNLKSFILQLFGVNFHIFLINSSTLRLQEWKKFHLFNVFCHFIEKKVFVSFPHNFISCADEKRLQSQFFHYTLSHFILWHGL